MEATLCACPCRIRGPHDGEARMSNLRIHGPCRLRFWSPSRPALSRTSLRVKLRPSSALIRGKLGEDFAELKITAGNESLSSGRCREASSAYSNSTSRPRSESSSGSRRLDSEDKNILILTSEVFNNSVLKCQLLLTYLFKLRALRFGRTTARSSLDKFWKSCSKVLLIGVLFVSLDLTRGGKYSRNALAAPTGTRTEFRNKANILERGQLRGGRQVVQDGGEKNEDRLAGGNDFEHGNGTVEKVLDHISTADRAQIETSVKFLRREEKLLSAQVDLAIDDYLSAREEVERLGSDVEASEKEEYLKEKVDVLLSYQRRLSEMLAASRKISQRMNQIVAPRATGVEQDVYSQLPEMTSGLEQLKIAIREHEILPLAAEVEAQTGIPAETEEDVYIRQRIELEETISQKLRDMLQRVVERLDDETGQEDPALEQSMSELRDLVLDESRWQEDEEARVALLENRTISKSLSAKEQEAILVARDRVLNETWYDEKKKRWEMKPSGALHAAQRQLVGRARIRHDRRVMYLTLKGNDREYFVNAKLYNAQFERYGGFHALFVKLIALGVPTSVEVMWVPLDEWEPEHLLQLPFKMISLLLENFWNSSLVVTVRPWYFNALMGAFEEVMIRFGFPTIHCIVPQKARVLLGFELAEGAEAAEPTEIILWQQEAQKHVDARYAEGSGSPVWWISLPVRCYVLGLPLLIVGRFVLGLLVRPFRPQPLEMNDAEWKEKKQEELIKKLDLQPKKQTIDPIKNVFDNMKRVRRPEVRLKDFAGIDIIKEEINEIISFLKNPKLFREIGARAPRGVLIVGESGTGKTTLALAIAAEARVPMVELQGSELEGGAWVGQGASNVRELFKTAREMAPLIIFMDDFDHFAGVRGATSDTRKQDHESLINQLLVELDGFETQEGVVLVATTSRPFAIDEALRRPGRMDRTIQLPLPNKQEREQILRQVAQRTMDAHLIDFVDWNKVAEKTAGLTPARLKYVPEGLEGSAVSYKNADGEELRFLFGWLAAINKASPRWLKESKFTKRYNEMLVDWLGLRVTKEDLEDAVEYLDVFGESRPGLELYDPPFVWTREFKLPHAVWAVGKALIALLLPDFDFVDMIWLNPTSWEGIAFTKFSKRLEGGYKESGTLTRSYYEKELVSYFGSFVASRMLLPFGENNSLCKDELESAKEVATRMVMEYGWAPDDSPMIYITDNAKAALAMGDKHEMDVAGKINQMFFSACEKAFHMLEQNRSVLEAMLEHLLENDVLNHQELERILVGKGAIYEELPFRLLPFTRSEIIGVSTNGTGRTGMEPAVPIIS